jgi:hypothetical protein
VSGERIDPQDMLAVLLARGMPWDLAVEVAVSLERDEPGRTRVPRRGQRCGRRCDPEQTS